MEEGIKVVEIEEAKFGKRKHNKGRLLAGQWIVGGIERGDKTKCFYRVSSGPGDWRT